MIVVACVIAGAGCGGGAAGTGAGGRGGGSGAGGGGAGTGSGSAADVARKLGRAPNFLVGMGNDLAGADAGYDHNKDGVYTLGVTMDLHDAYMVGLPGQGGWPDWNAEGSFVNILSKPAADHGVTPMYTLYAMASIGDGNLSGLATDTFMRPYWDGVRLLYQRIAWTTGRRWSTSSPTSGRTRSRWRAAVRPACPSTSRVWCPSAPVFPTIWRGSGTASFGWGGCSRPRR